MAEPKPSLALQALRLPPAALKGWKAHASELPQRTVSRVRARATFNQVGIAAAGKLIGRLPARDEVFHCLMGGDFNGWDLVPTIQRLAGAPVAELWVSTLGFNTNNNAQLCQMLDAGTVRRVCVIASCFFRDQSADTYDDAAKELESRGQRLVAVRNHSKVLLLRFAAPARYFVVESSANLRSCNNLEQFSLTESREVFNFHRGWMQSVAEHPERYAKV